MLQLETTPTRLFNADTYTTVYDQYIQAMQMLLVTNNISKIEFTQDIVAGGHPATLRAALLVTSPQSTSSTLPVTVPVADTSTLYK